MKIANSMKTNDKLSGCIIKSALIKSALNPILAIVCVIALLVSGCQSSSSSSSSSSTATSSPSTPAPSPSPQTSSQSQSQSSSSSSSASQGQPQQQNSSSSQEPGGSETAYEEEGSESSGGEPGAGEDFPSQGEPGGLPGDVLSQEEAVAVLDGQFDESIAVFDGMIIGERAAAQAAQDEFPEEDDSVFGDDNPLFEEADISEDSDSQGSPTDGQEGEGGLYSGGGGDGTAGETASSRTGSRRGGINTNMPGGPVPSDIPDGSDDDIVARQIREAAMKEQDPVLREKLWDEYRKYKKGQ
jgi:hypothetical protein